MTHYQIDKSINLDKTLSNNILTSSGAFTGLIDKPDKYNYTLDELKKYNAINENNVEYENIDLVSFSRLYKIGSIPIFDFVVFYIVFYAINALYLDFSYKIVLFGAIICTVLFNLITNNECHMSYLILFILAISTYYLILSVPSLNIRLKKLISNQL